MPVAVNSQRHLQHQLIRHDSSSSCSSEESETISSKEKQKLQSFEVTGDNPSRRSRTRRSISHRQTVHLQRSVSFLRTVEIQETLHVNDLTREEIASTWYTKDDYLQMRTSMNKTIQMISNGKYNGDTNEHCDRGLECCTREGSDQRKKNKLTALVAVLEEQERQREEDDEDDRDIAKAYILVSHRSAIAASRMGNYDEKAANEIHNEKGEPKQVSPKTETVEPRKTGIRRLFARRKSATT